MFYINNGKKTGNNDKFLFHILPTLVVFTAFMGVTFYSWTTAKTTVKNEQLKVLQQHNDQAAVSIKQRMETYGDILRGASGLFGASQEVTRDEWKEYLSSYDIDGRYPGIQGIGYIEVIKPDNLSNHIDRIRSQGLDNYNVYPNGTRNIYTSIVYIEPFNNVNAKAFGYDMYSEKTRQEAMNEARDSGRLAVSDIVTLLQDQTRNEASPGFLMYLPIYKNGTAPEKLEEKRQNLTGYIYAAFRAKDLINQTVNNSDSYFGFQVNNIGSGNNKQFMYQTVNFKNLIDKDHARHLGTEISLPGTTWQVIGAVTDSAVSEPIKSRPLSVSMGGILFSLIVASFLYLLLGNRARTLAEKEELTIQEAKDELLALASHQLRTPATGVKQYVGMLVEGFAGEITTTQRQLLEKAYESNERQLTTINEMLFVARADAGQLKLVKNTVDLSEMTKSIVDEQIDVFHRRHQTIKIIVPSKPIFVSCDQQYLRMAFENLINNASKYTRDKGKIEVSLSALKSKVIFKVKDNGVGVEDIDKTLLFKKFSRIPNELTGQVSGSGIGLYLARQVVEAHKGKIKFISVADEGSEVIIELPNKTPKAPKNSSND